MTTKGAHPGLFIHLLGEFWVAVDGRRIADPEWRLRKAKALLAALALEPGHRLPVEQAAELLWPESDGDRARMSLNRTLGWLRRLLDRKDHRGAEWRYLRLRQGTLRLGDASSVTVDVEAFEAAAADALHTRAPDACSRALELYTGDPLVDTPDEPWVVRRREELMTRYATLLLSAAEVYAERGDTTRAILALRLLAAAQPTHEEAQARLIRLYATTDNRYAALRQYQILRDTLRREPEASLQSLYRALAASNNAPRDTPDAGADADASGETDSDAQSGEADFAAAADGFAPPTSFIGRRQELTEVARLLGAARLITLTGAGGSGKTRLALAEAGAAGAAFPDGVWVVGLASIAVEPAVTDAARLVAEAVAAALGLSAEDGQREEALIAAIGAGRTLLVLDNCEHLYTTCAALAAALLRGCPHLHILATSRRRLGMRGEVVYTVPPLAVPEAERLPPFDLVQHYDAVRLFVTRARAVQPDLALTPRNAADVVDICRRLAGMPLAIELAAARCRMLSAREIARRLDDCFAVLAANPAGVPRQRTLEATLSWSYGMLSPRERLLLARLAVFGDGWTLEAAGVVCAGADIAPREVLESLSELVEQSLVRVERREPGTRYRMLEPIRQYAERRLRASGKEEEVRRRHAAWALALAEEAEPRLTGPEQQHWMARLDDERDNLRAALGWTMQTEAVETGLRLATSLERYWWVRGMLGEGRSWHDRLLTLARCVPDLPEPLLACAFYSSGRLACLQGDFAVAEERATEALRLCERLGNPARETVGAMTVLSELAYERGEPARARELLEAALEVARARHDAHCQAVTLSNLADKTSLQGDLARAAELYAQCLEIGRAAEDASAISMALINLGKVALARGELAAAPARLYEGLALARQLGALRGEADTLVALGELAVRQGDRTRAMERFREAFERYLTSSNYWLAADALEHLAAMFADLKRTQAATVVLGAEQAMRIEHRLPNPDRNDDYARLVGALRVALGSRRFAECWEAGLALPPLGALEEALGAASSNRGGRRRSRPAARGPTAQGLTTRQAQVAALAAQGLTSQRISEMLCINKRTVDKHISAILAKLDITSRDGIAAKLQSPR
jgi:predicted ATPase/DNA-binding SARP family transcriptional activator/DNA-binding CsgD family transcriptional regulator